MKISCAVMLLGLAGFAAVRTWNLGRPTPRFYGVMEWPANQADLLARMVPVPAGTYRVGTHHAGGTPRREVVISGFRIWPTEVTQAEWAAFHGATVFTDRARFPADALSYQDVMVFCREVSARYGVKARLPTLAEWQVAASAGTPGVPYPWGWAPPQHRAAFDLDSASPVATYPANPWGLYDMSGNVAEWVLSDDASSHAPVMGGSWSERSPEYVNIHNVISLPKQYRDRDVGFRFVIEHDQNPSSALHRGL